MRKQNKKVLIAAAAYNWAECHRMAGIGREFLKYGYEVYSLGTGRYDYLLKEGMIHLSLKEDEYWYTEERIWKLMHMDSYGNDYCEQEELEEMIEAERKLFQQIKPELVVTGYRTTLSLSCRIEKIPLVWVLSAVVSPLYYKYGLATMPERVPVQFVNHIKDKKLQAKYYCTLALKNNGTSKIWNKTAKKYELSGLKSDLEIFTGDLSLMSDIPDFFPDFKKLPKEFQFCGPLFNYEDIAWPECMKDYDQTKKCLRIFVTLGSSGEEKIVFRILNDLKQVDAEIFVATTSIIDKKVQKEFPDNFYFAEKFPHRKIAEWVDLSIIHGGQGTLYTTILGGKPFIGVPMFSEQQYNIENMVRYGSGEHISVEALNNGVLKQTIEKVVNTESYFIQAQKVRKMVIPYYQDESKNASYVAVRKIMEYFWNE